MNKIIDTAKDCLLKIFEKCLFDDKYDDLVIEGDFTDEEKKQAFSSIYTEFIDTSGLIESADFELLKTIFYLDCRVKKINLLLYIQHESIEKIGMPCIKAFENINIYGHKLYWDKENPDIEAFQRRLQDIESKERKYRVELEGKTKEFFALKERQVKAGIQVYQKRKDFVRTKNNLQKHGYVIDRDKTMVDEFALMLCDYNDAMQKETVYKKN